jgi:hypothetical protein
LELDKVRSRVRVAFRVWVRSHSTDKTEARHRQGTKEKVRVRVSEKKI